MRRFGKARVLVCVVAACLVVVSVWCAYDAHRPGDTAQWKRFMAEGAAFAHDESQYSHAEETFAAAIEEAKRFKQPDVRLADSELCLAEVYALEVSQYDGSPVPRVTYLDVLVSRVRSGKSAALDKLSEKDTADYVLRARDNAKNIKPLCLDAEARYHRALPAESLILAEKLSDMSKQMCVIEDPYSGMKDQSIRLSLDALHIAEKVYGTDSPEILKYLYQSADRMSIYNANHYPPIVSLCERAVALCTKSCGLADYRTTRAITILARCYPGGYQAKVGYLRMMIGRYEDSLGKDDPHLIPLLSYLGRMYTDKARYAEAGPVFERAIKIAESHYKLRLDQMTRQVLDKRKDGKQTICLLKYTAQYLVGVKRNKEALAINIRMRP